MLTGIHMAVSMLSLNWQIHGKMLWMITNLQANLYQIYRSIVYHGHSIEDSLASVTASFPKCLLSSLNTSNNYGGIPLSCSHCKVIDYVLLINTLHILNMSSNLEFVLEAKHDIICLSAFKETVIISHIKYIMCMSVWQMQVRYLTMYMLDNFPNVD